MAGTCELCGGKIVNGRCTECGMDYSRMKNRYHLNENCSDYDLNAREISKRQGRTAIRCEKGKNRIKRQGISET